MDVFVQVHFLMFKVKCGAAMGNRMKLQNFDWEKLMLDS